MSACTNQFTAGPAKPQEPIANNANMNEAFTLNFTVCLDPRPTGASKSFLHMKKFVYAQENGSFYLFFLIFFLLWKFFNSSPCALVNASEV